LREGLKSQEFGEEDLAVIEKTVNTISLGSSWTFPSMRQVATRAFETALDWHQRARERKTLASLDNRMLADIGVTRADVWRETNKPFWRI
jgi:uncharacterized protein YjiS (DUF1127 family)